MPSSLWVASAFPAATSSIYFMSATHRGDMYHIRAAMSILGQERAIYLYESSGATDDVVNYLKAGAKEKKKAYFVAPWVRNAALGKTMPQGQTRYGFWDDKTNSYQEGTTNSDFTSRKYSFIGEGEATRRFSAAVATDFRLFEETKRFMTLIPSDKERDIQDEFALLNLFGKWPKPARETPTILVLHRASGTNPKGPYPEYDTGKALAQIMQTIRTQNNAAGKVGIRAVVAGDVRDTSDTPSIGKYWDDLSKVNSKVPSVSKRDLEAYFIKRAYETGWFQMAVGFRSGGLDLFTFLGIPTVSIGLVNVMAEDRHEMLATANLRRVNVQYYMPRHPTTAWVAAKDVSRMIQSPFFRWDPPSGISKPRPRPTSEDQENEMQRPDPGPFTDFDLWTFQVGLAVACSRHLDGWGQTLRHVIPLDGASCVIRARQARYAFPSSLNLADEEQLQRFLKWNAERQDMDARDIAARRTPESQARLQEPESVNNEHENESKGQWNFIQKLLEAMELPDIS